MRWGCTMGGEWQPWLDEATAMRRRRLIGLVLAGLWIAPAVRAGEVADATEPIAELNQGLLTIMKAGLATPFPRRYDTLAPIVERVFDLPGILRACVGPRWAALGTQEQSDLGEVFRRFTVASYVANFTQYSGERFEVSPESHPGAGGEIVETRIMPASGNAVRIDYLMRQQAEGWKVVDVLLNGSISRVAVQRSDFRGLLGGATDASGLIASLQQKVADLSGGTLSAG